MEENPIKEQKIAVAGSANALSIKINTMISEGWLPVGSHQVSRIDAVNRYSGTQHMSTMYSYEYSQTLIRY
jgi:hypothetical protein